MHQWVIVADSVRARIFRRQATNAALEEIADLVAPEGHAFARDMKSDRPGRGFSSASGTIHHALEPETGAVAQRSHDFARRIAETVEKALEQDEFNQLLIAAAPHFLGELRQALSDQSKARIVLAIDKDIVAMDEPKIRAALAAAAA